MSRFHWLLNDEHQNSLKMDCIQRKKNKIHVPVNWYIETNLDKCHNWGLLG